MGLSSESRGDPVTVGIENRESAVKPLLFARGNPADAIA